MAESYQFLLVHGSWMGGSAWDGVRTRLEALGHSVHTPTLAGHGPGAVRQVTHAQVVQSVVDYIANKDLRDFVLVGHSFGGTVIQKVAEAVPDRIRRIVFWNAFVLLDGECLSQHTPAHTAEMFAQLAEASGDGTIMLPFEVFRDLFMNDADLALARQVYDGLFPEFANLFLEKIALPRFFQLPIPKSYLYSWDDHGLPHGEASGWYPKFGNRLGLFRFVSMPGGHMALFTRPDDLADRIIEAGRD